MTGVVAVDLPPFRVLGVCEWMFYILKSYGVFLYQTFDVLICVLFGHKTNDAAYILLTWIYIIEAILIFPFLLIGKPVASLFRLWFILFGIPLTDSEVQFLEIAITILSIPKLIVLMCKE